MRVLFVLSLLLIIMSCKELGEALEYEKPVIEKLELSQNIVNKGDIVTATVTATNPEEGTLAYSWEAPDGGEFIPPTNEETVQWIAPNVGRTYKIRAVVKNDKKATKTAEVTVRSYEKPIIEDLDLSSNVVYPGDTVVATVTATNPEKGVLTYAWEAPDGGQFIPPTDEVTVQWVAPFIGKSYRIRAVVSNDEKSTLTKSVTVQSLTKPFVQILSPEDNEYFIQGGEIEISVNAYHDNHLSQVWLLVDNVFVDSLAWDASNNYIFKYVPDFSIVGETELKILAEVFNQPGNTASDYVTVSIEGILPKPGKP